MQLDTPLVSTDWLAAHLDAPGLRGEHGLLVLRRQPELLPELREHEAGDELASQPLDVGEGGLGIGVACSRGVGGHQALL